MVDPFIERIWRKSATVEQEDEIEILAKDQQIINKINEVLKKLLSVNAVMTNNLKDWLCRPLVNYIAFLKG